MAFYSLHCFQLTTVIIITIKIMGLAAYLQTFTCLSFNVVLHCCLSFLFCCCDKISQQKQLLEKQFILAHGSRLWSVIVVNSQWMELERTGHTKAINYCMHTSNACSAHFLCLHTAGFPA